MKQNRKIKGNPLKEFEYSFKNDIDLSSITKENIDDKMGYILSYFHKIYDIKDSRKFLIKREKKHGNSIKSIPDTKYYGYITLGFVAKILDDTNVSSDKIDEWYSDTLKNLLSSVGDIKCVRSEKSGGYDIQARIREQAREIMPEIDQYIDDRIDNKKNDFDIYEHIKKSKLSPVHMRKIYNILKAEMDEFSLAREDKELAEGYRCFGKRKLNNIVKIYEYVLEIIEKFITLNTKKKVVTRKPKKVSMEKKLSGLNFLKFSDEYDLASEDPSKLFGSKFVVLFNVKTKTMKIITSKDGMMLRGSTLYDFDTSVEKRLRKPKEMVSSIKGGKRAILSVFDSFTTKLNESNGRINKDTIILKIL